MTEFQTRLAANALRRQRETFLDATTSQVRALLEGAPFLVLPESDKIEPLRCITPEGLGATNPLRPPQYVFREVSFEAEALDLLNSLTATHDELPAYLAFSTHLPVFRVNFGEARRELRSLWAVAGGHLLLMTEKLEAGIGIDECIGYLEPHPNPDGLLRGRAMACRLTSRCTCRPRASAASARFSSYDS